MMKSLLPIVAIALTGCGAKIYNEAKGNEGEFTGSLFVMWVADRCDDSGVGDGCFVYIPDKRGNNGLRYTREQEVDGDKVNVKVIEPQLMYTDGGSIPSFAQPFRGLNPWGYAPPYMVHDWLFVAHRCIKDGLARPEEKAMANVGFIESYEIMAEMIRTLEKTKRISGGDVKPIAITTAVTSGISQARWEADGECADDRISEELVERIRQRLKFDPITGESVTEFFGDSLEPDPQVFRIDFPAHSD